jgi:mannose-1-phosphate guanylyltransferase/mannose-6-phosphate isomerase
MQGQTEMPGSRVQTTRAALALAPVVLAGGKGTRLWPMSREQYPKQLLGLAGNDTLLQATLARTAGLAAAHTMLPPIVVCPRDLKDATVGQIVERGVEARYILEPVGRNTAPALTLAAAMLAAQGDDAIMIAMPADHAIADVPAFERALTTAARHAAEGAIVLLGVPATRPDVGFGYLQLGARLADGTCLLQRFVEKPAQELAQRYVASGEYCWNSGLFVMQASVWLDVLAAVNPQMHAACLAAYADGTRSGACFTPEPQRFAQVPSDSIDYAVMERLGTNGVPTVIVPLDAGWSDLGTWDAVYQSADKDAHGNVTQGRVELEGTRGSFVKADARLVACVDVTDVVVVETEDAVLVTDRRQAGNLKALVERISARAAPEAKAPRTVKRPWGSFSAVANGARFQVKVIVVQPGASLSLQLHHHRAEHWIVVSGTARVTRGDETLLLGENESTYIPLGVKHRLSNPGKLPLQLIEVQSGAYLGEDDIVRFEDSYGRN